MVFTTWDGVVPPDKINLLKEMYALPFDVPMLESQISFIYRYTDQWQSQQSCSAFLKNFPKNV
jgi:hypothetical protein